MHAYCWRDGVIGFGRHVPKGALPILEGRGRKFREHVQICARRAYDRKTYLVPGIPEAGDDVVALAALKAFRDWVAKGAPVSTTTGGALV